MIHVINFGSSKTPKITSIVSESGFEVEEVNWKDFSPADYGRQEKIIFSGSPTFLTEVDHSPYTERYSCITRGVVPVLGICFGHQVMGIIHGAQIFRGPEVRTEIPIHSMKEDPLFEGLTSTVRMTEDHTEGITLPASFIHLATSEDYAIEGMRHPYLPLWGVQFHPEVSGDNGRKLIRNFLDNKKEG